MRVTAGYVFLVLWRLMMAKKKTKTVKVTCTKCSRVVRVSKGSRCDREQLCYACITTEVEESNDCSNFKL